MRATRLSYTSTMHQLRNLPISLRILSYAAIAAVLFAVATGMGATAALLFGPAPGSSGDESTGAEYVSVVGEIQNRAVEASLESNDRLLRYDDLTEDDIEEVQANYEVLKEYSDRAEGLDPPEKYEEQHRVFILAIGELRRADEMAYRLAIDPTSVTQTELDAYDGGIDKATEYLRRSNEILGKDYKTTQLARDVSFG